jgi:hypothetical protein
MVRTDGTRSLAAIRGGGCKEAENESVTRRNKKLRGVVETSVLQAVRRAAPTAV